MPPAARLSLAFIKHLPSITMGPSTFRVQGWDPVLIISQIVSLQALHYLSLSLLLPPLLSLFASPTLLSYEGGPSSVSMIIDWREFVGISTVSIAAAKGSPGGLMGLSAARVVKEAAGGRSGNVAAALAAAAEVTVGDLSQGLVRIVEADPMRGWVVALGWILTSLLDVVYMYHLVRRPTHILDFSLTLIFNHLILTTYYANAFPTSLFFWFILSISTVAQVVLAEQCCVARDMHEGFTVVDPTGNSPRFGSPTSTMGPPSTLAPTPGSGRGKEDIELSAMGAINKHSARIPSLSLGPPKQSHHKTSSISSTATMMGGSGSRYQPIPTSDDTQGPST